MVGSEILAKANEKTSAKNACGGGKAEEPACLIFAVPFHLISPSLFSESLEPGTWGWPGLFVLFSFICLFVFILPRLLVKKYPHHNLNQSEVKPKCLPVLDPNYLFLL